MFEASSSATFFKLLAVESNSAVTISTTLGSLVQGLKMGSATPYVPKFSPRWAQADSRTVY